MIVKAIIFESCEILSSNLNHVLITKRSWTSSKTGDFDLDFHGQIGLETTLFVLIFLKLNKLEFYLQN